MKLLFLSGVALGAGEDAYAEDVKDVAEPLASSLIRRGKAVPFEAAKKKDKKDKTDKKGEGKAPAEGEGGEDGEGGEP